MIRIEKLNKSFGELHVLKDVSLEVKQGEIFGLIGKVEKENLLCYVVLICLKKKIVGSSV